MNRMHTRTFFLLSLANIIITNYCSRLENARKHATVLFCLNVFELTCIVKHCFGRFIEHETTCLCSVSNLDHLTCPQV